MAGHVNTKDAVKNRQQAGGVMYAGQPAGDDLFEGAESSPVSIESLNWSMTGVVIDRELNEGEWLNLIQGIRAIKRAYMWALADLLKYGIERGYGDTREKYEAVAKLTGYTPEGLQNLASIARSVEISRRRENLSFSHHTEVAPLTPDEQTYWLEQAAVKHWSAKRLRSEIATPQLPAETSPLDIEMPDGVTIERVDLTPLPEQEAVARPASIREVRNYSRKFWKCIEADRLQDMEQDEMYLYMLFVQDKFAQLKRMKK